MNPLDRVLQQYQHNQQMTDSVFDISTMPNCDVSLSFLQREIDSLTSTSNVPLVHVYTLCESLARIRKHDFHEALNDLHSILRNLLFIDDWCVSFGGDYLVIIVSNVIIDFISYLKTVNVINDEIVLISIHLLLLIDPNVLKLSIPTSVKSQPPQAFDLSMVMSLNVLLPHYVCVNDGQIHMDYSRIAHDVEEIVTRNRLTPVTSLLLAYLFQTQIFMSKSRLTENLDDLAARIKFLDSENSSVPSHDPGALRRVFATWDIPGMNPQELFLAVSGCLNVVISRHPWGGLGEYELQNIHEVWRWCTKSKDYLIRYFGSRETIDPSFRPKEHAEKDAISSVCELNYLILPYLPRENLKEINLNEIDTQLMFLNSRGAPMKTTYIVRSKCYQMLHWMLVNAYIEQKKTPEIIDKIFECRYLFEISIDKSEEILTCKFSDFAQINCSQDDTINLKLNWLIDGYRLLSLRPGCDDGRLHRKLIAIENSLDPVLDPKWKGKRSLFLTMQQNWKNKIAMAFKLLNPSPSPQAAPSTQQSPVKLVSKVVRNPPAVPKSPPKAPANLQKKSEPSSSVEPASEEDKVKQLVEVKLGELVFPSYELDLSNKILRISSINEEKMRLLHSIIKGYGSKYHLELKDVKFGKSSSFGVKWKKTKEFHELFCDGAFCGKIKPLATPANADSASGKSSDQADSPKKSALLATSPKQNIDWQIWSERLELLACGAKIRSAEEGYLVIDFKPIYNEVLNTYTLFFKLEKERREKQPVKLEVNINLISEEIISRLVHEEKGLNLKLIPCDVLHQFKVIPNDPVPNQSKILSTRSNISGHLASKLPSISSEKSKDTEKSEGSEDSKDTEKSESFEESKEIEDLPPQNENPPSALLPPQSKKPVKPTAEKPIGKAKKILDHLESFTTKEWHWLKVEPKETKRDGLTKTRWIFSFATSGVKTIGLDERHINTKEFLLTYISSINFVCRQEVIVSKDYKENGHERFQFSVFEDMIHFLEDPELVKAVEAEVSQWVKAQPKGVMITYAGDESELRKSVIEAGPVSQQPDCLPPLPKAVSGLLPPLLLRSALMLLNLAKTEQVASKDMTLLREWHYHLLVCVHNIRKHYSTNAESWTGLRVIFRHHNLSLKWEEDFSAIRTITHYVLHFLSPGPQKRNLSLLEKNIELFLENNKGGSDEMKDLEGLESRIADEKNRLEELVKKRAAKEAILMTASIIGALFNLTEGMKLKVVDELCRDICRDVGHDPSIDDKWERIYRPDLFEAFSK